MTAKCAIIRLAAFAPAAALACCLAFVSSARGAEDGGWAPRLYYTPAAMEAFGARIAEDERIEREWKAVLARADEMLDAELVSLEYAESGSGQHGNYGRPSGQMSGMGATLGLAWRMTGNEAYAAKLRGAMLHYAKLNRWAGNADREPPWHSELNTARFCFGYAAGYDAIRGYLSNEDRRTIVDAMVNKGILPTLGDWILPERRIHALDSMGHNWWSVCVSMAGVAALAVMEDEPRARGWAETVSDSFPEWFAYRGNVLQNKSPNFDRRGAFYESVSYANYALAEYLLFRLAHSNALPGAAAPDIPLLETAGDFFLHAAYPADGSLLSVNFGDSALTATGAKTLALLQATGYGKPAYNWYLSQCGWRPDPVCLVWDRFEPRSEPPSGWPRSILYPDTGWAMFRNSWRDNSTLLAVKSGIAWNHAHPDASSFILFHSGKPLIIDSGNCSYSRREYTSYYRHSRAHNVVLIDGEAQHPEDVAGGDRGTAVPGRLLHRMDCGGIRYVLADATGPTAWKFTRNYRHFLWIGGVILIVDDLRAHEAGRMEWLLHHAGEAIEADGTILLDNGPGCRAVVVPLHPQGMAVNRKMGLEDHDPDTEREYLALTPPGEHREMKFLTAIVPLGPGGERPAADIVPLEGENMLGARISDGGTVTEVFLNLQADGRRMHRNGNNTIHGWETDAYLFGLTRPAGAPDIPDSARRGFVICGSYLRKNGQVMLDSLSKVYAAFSAEGDVFEAELRGQPVIRCGIRTVSGTERHVLNGRPFRPRSVGGGVAEFRLPMD